MLSFYFFVMGLARDVNTQRIEQNGFRLLEQVDDTSRTTIWKAVQTTLDRTVIVQVLKSHVSEDPDEVNHFLTTARLFARVKSDAIAAFILYDKVALYGGFAGHEKTLEERDLSKNVTTLSAKVKKSGYRFPHVLYGADQVTLDGLRMIWEMNK